MLWMKDVMKYTPFANVEDIPTDPANINPFKPCTHGQFRFTKFNIIDKFGQVVSGLGTFSDLNNNVGPAISPLLPCLGDSYSVQANTDGSPKIVLPRTTTDGLCPFVQLPPSINQDARVNFDFVTQVTLEDNTKEWRETSEWENPVKGWLVINYANASVQVFKGDGGFVHEYSVLTDKVIIRPFAGDITGLDPLLASFLSQFNNGKYLFGLFRSITKTIETIQASPSFYSDNMLSIIGRPLALTFFGISLELADPPRQNLCTGITAPTDDLLSYNFPFKLGDADNIFDGLYGIFGANGTTIDYSTFYTYQPPNLTTEPSLQADPSTPITSHHPFSFSPFYASPYYGPISVSRTRAATLQIFPALIDPFTAVHAYTALLPIKALSLPPLVLSTALRSVTAFFKTGPLLLNADVPPYSHLQGITNPTDTTTSGSIEVPSVSLAEWTWLQPYWTARESDGSDPSEEAGRTERGAVEGATRFNGLEVKKPGDKLAWQPPPLTAVEGYLVMKKGFQMAAAGK